MQQVVPWTRLIAVIEPHYPKSGKRGRQPLGIERMLRMYLLQHWFVMQGPRFLLPIFIIGKIPGSFCRFPFGRVKTIADLW